MKIAYISLMLLVTAPCAQAEFNAKKFFKSALYDGTFCIAEGVVTGKAWSFLEKCLNSEASLNKQQDYLKAGKALPAAIVIAAGKEIYKLSSDLIKRFKGSGKPEAEKPEENTDGKKPLSAEKLYGKLFGLILSASAAGAYCILNMQAPVAA